MFRTDLMLCTHQSALQQGESVFHGIGVDVTVNVDAPFVLNGLMAANSGTSRRVRVGGPFVCDDDFHVLADVLAHVLRQSRGLGIAGMEHAEFAVALADADHDLFVLHTGKRGNWSGRWESNQRPKPR